MQKQSSYIFLIHPFKKKTETTKDNNSNRKKMEFNSKSIDGVNKFISKTFAPIKRVDNKNNFFVEQFEYEFDSCNITFTIHSVSGLKYLDINVEHETSEEKIIKCLEEVQDKLLNSGIRNNYIEIISYDAISEYYCNKMVVKLNEFERNLRKLFFNIYILNFGKEYYQATISKPVSDKIKELINSETTGEQRGKIKSYYNVKSNNEVKEILRLQQFFYSLELGDILNFLFEPRFTEYDKKATEKFLSKHSDLSKLTDEELRNAFSKFLPKSDWDRFFSEKIKIDNIKELIDEIRKYRNSVAHFKFFYNKDYTECNKKVTELNNAIIEAIRITEEKDFADKNEEIIKKCFSRLNESIQEAISHVNVSINKTLNEAISRTYEPLKQMNEYYKNIINSLAHIGSDLVRDIQIPQISIPNIQSEDDKIDFSDHDIDDKDEAAADDNI